MSPHTPGPWHVVHGLYPDGEVEVQGGGANLTGPITHLANANLIATAPDLLAALKSLMEPEQQCSQGVDTDVWERVEAAVAKAEGRQP